MYTLSPWNKTNICHSLANDASSCDNKHTGQDDYSCGAHNDTASRTNAGDKHNSSTTPEGKAKPFQTQCQKKQRCRVANDTPKHQNTDMGMFWLHNPRIKITDVFPTNLPEKVCVNFCCRGRLGFILCGSQFDIFSWFGMFSTCSRVIPIFYVVLSQPARNHKKTGISFCFDTILTSFVHQEKNNYTHTMTHTANIKQHTFLSLLLPLKHTSSPAPPKLHHGRLSCPCIVSQPTLLRPAGAIGSMTKTHCGHVSAALDSVQFFSFWSSKSKFPLANFGSAIEVILEYVGNRSSGKPVGGVKQNGLIPCIGRCLTCR